MIEVALGLLWFSILASIIIWLLHVSAIRESPMLSRFEDRFPRSADFVNTISVDKWESLGQAPAPKGLRLTYQILAWFGVIGFAAIGLYSFYMLVNGRGF